MQSAREIGQGPQTEPSAPASAPLLQIPVASTLLFLCFQLTSWLYLGVLPSPSLALISLLEELTERGETLALTVKDTTKRGTDEEALWGSGGGGGQSLHTLAGLPPPGNHTPVPRL